MRPSSNFRLLGFSMLISCCLAGPFRPLDIALVVDSAHVFWDNFEIFTNNMKQFIEALGVEENDHRISIVYYNAGVTIALTLAEGTTTVRCLQAVDNVAPRVEGRNTHLALAAVRQQVFVPEAGDREGVANVAILLITGTSYQPFSTLTESNLLKTEDVSVFSLGIGRWVSDAEIQFLATKPASYFSKRIRSVSELSDRLSAMASNQGSFEDEPRVAECAPLFDLAFIIDASSSMSLEDFELEKQFIDKLVSSFDISPQNSRVGLVAFNNDSRIIFNMATYSSYSPMKKAVLSVGQTGAGRVLHKAMRFCRNSLFRNRRLDQSEVPIPQILIIITGGKARYPQRVLEEANLLKQDGITIFTISVSKTKQTLMSRIASIPITRYNFNLLQFSQLNLVYADMVNTTCKELAILTQKTIDEHFDYGTKLPTEECHGFSDILFFFQLPDRDEDLETLRSYLETLIRYLDIGQDNIKVALAGLADTVIPITTFLQNADKNTTIQALRYFDTSSNNTGRFTGHFFSSKHSLGWRDNVVKIAVFFIFGLNDEVTVKHMSNFLNVLNRQDILRFVINIGQSPDRFGDMLASEPKSSHVIYAPYMDTLMMTAPYLLDRICDEATPANYIRIW